MSSLCPECGVRTMSSSKSLRCKYCYFNRKGIESAARKHHCVSCGAEVSTRKTKQCRKCWQNRSASNPKKLIEATEKETQRLNDLANSDADPLNQIRQPLTTFEEGWAQFQKTIGMMRDRYKGPAKKDPDALDPNRKRILVIPDLHVPFHEPKMVADMIARESGKTDLAICIGDVGDAYALSRFAKYETVPYAYEWSEVTVMMQTLSESFPEVKIIIGNHDARLRRAIANHLTSDMVEAITTMAGGTLCPITALARKYDNISVAKHPVPNTDMTVDWLMVEGDALLAHPEKYSRVPGNALRAFEEWAADNAAAIGLDSIRLLVMGHTHQMAILPWRSNSLLVECGCLCQTQGYMTGARIGGRPQRRGYIWFDQYDGVTDLNSVGFRWYDIEKGPWRK